VSSKEELKDILRREEPHPISILKAEHEIILDNLKILDEIANRIKHDMDLDRLNAELERLKPVVELLLEAESHHQREERVLFPRLEEHGIIGPPNIMRKEHEYLRTGKKALKRLLEEYDTLDKKQLTDMVYELGNYIVLTLREHIQKENHILYPLALGVIPKTEWDKIRKEFDTIGYCCFTPYVETHEEYSDQR